eukprot:m.182870 g.182870  ORF g.182870 m.182870 type:complete len:72 (+) comp39296_c0_seq3:573-788(+)
MKMKSNLPDGEGGGPARKHKTLATDYQVLKCLQLSTMERFVYAFEEMELVTLRMQVSLVKHIPLELTAINV